MAVPDQLPRVKRGTGRPRTEEEREAGLLAFVLCAGHRDRASALVKESHGFEIPGKTIYNWSENHADQLERIRQEVAPKLKAQMAEMHQSLAAAAGEIEAKAIERLHQHLEANTINGKDLSAVMQRAAIATGIHGEKHLLYSGQPTSIVRRDFDEIKRELKAKGVILEGTAVEID